MCGTVSHQRADRGAGGPVLEVDLSDGTATLGLVFLGRRRIAGISIGRVVTAAGMVGTRHGRLVLLNPLYWLSAHGEVSDA